MYVMDEKRKAYNIPYASKCIWISEGTYIKQAIEWIVYCNMFTVIHCILKEQTIIQVASLASAIAGITLHHSLISWEQGG